MQPKETAIMELKQLHVYLKNAVSLVEDTIAAEDKCGLSLIREQYRYVPA